jgi:hypothetical protein
MVELCLQQRWRKVIIEGDALTIVNMLRSEGSWMGRHGDVVMETKILLLGNMLDWRVHSMFHAGGTLSPIV